MDGRQDWCKEQGGDVSDVTVPSAREATRLYWGKPGPEVYSRNPINFPKGWDFLECVKDDNPVYWDEEFARKTRFGGRISPPHGLMPIAGGVWWIPDYMQDIRRGWYVMEPWRDQDDQPRGQAAAKATEDDPPGIVDDIISRMGYTILANAAFDQEFFSPFREGDGHTIARITVFDVSEEKQTRVGRGVFVSAIWEAFAERDRRLLVTAKINLLHYMPDTAKV